MNESHTHEWGNTPQWVDAVPKHYPHEASAGPAVHEHHLQGLTDAAPMHCPHESGACSHGEGASVAKHGSAVSRSRLALSEVLTTVELLTGTLGLGFLILLIVFWQFPMCVYACECGGVNITGLHVCFCICICMGGRGVGGVRMQGAN